MAKRISICMPILMIQVIVWPFSVNEQELIMAVNTNVI